MGLFEKEFNESLKYANKTKNIKNIKNFLVNSINENQTIKRLTRYLTTTPLLNEGVKYSGELIEQPDLKCGLLDNLREDKENGIYLEDPNVQTRKRILIPYQFDDKLMRVEQMYIFINNFKNRFSSKYNTGEYIFEIIVTYDINYNILEPYGEERILLILEKLEELFDEQYVDSEENIGVIKLHITDIEDIKVSKSIMGKIITIESEVLDNREIINYA